MSEEASEGCLLDVDLLDWANQWVGKHCLRCETEIRYHSMGVNGGQGEHRIECACTLIESTVKA